jgi:hypothetical protein
MVRFPAAMKMSHALLVGLLPSLALLAPSFDTSSVQAELIYVNRENRSVLTCDTTTPVPTIFTAGQSQLTGLAFNEQKTIAVGQPKMIRKRGTVSGNVRCELQDKAGNLWFSTGGEGVYRFDGKSFTNFKTKEGLFDDHVSAIIEDKDGNILFGTRSGLCKYDGKSFAKYADNADLSTMAISSLLEDRGGNLWLGTLSRGVYRYDGKSFINFLNNDDHKFNLGNHYQTILDILEDKNGNIWFSSWNGGGVWRYDGKSFKNFIPSADYYLRNEDGRSGARSALPEELFSSNKSLPKKTICDDMIFSITEDKAGNLWFATRNHGACRYDGEFFTIFKGHEQTYSILEDKMGNIWITTNDHGVWRYDGKTFRQFTAKDGLINDSVFSVLEDRSGNLWFGTRNFGLSRYDGKTFTNFSE